MRDLDGPIGGPDLAVHCHALTLARLARSTDRSLPGGCFAGPVRRHAVGRLPAIPPWGGHAAEPSHPDGRRVGLWYCGRMTVSEKVTALATGASAFLAKPYRPAELIDTVAVLEGRTGNPG